MNQKKENALGVKIKMARIESGMTQAAMAVKIGVARITYANLEGGRYDLVHTIVRRVVVQYDDGATEHRVSVEFLLPVGDTGGTPPPIAPPRLWRVGRNGRHGVSLKIAGNVCSGAPGVRRARTYI